MTTDCSLFMKIVSSEYLQNMLCTQIVVFVLFWHSEQFWYTTCSANVASFWKRFTCTSSKLNHSSIIVLGHLIYMSRMLSLNLPHSFRFYSFWFIPFISSYIHQKRPHPNMTSVSTMKPKLFWIQIWWHQTFLIIPTPWLTLLLVLGKSRVNQNSC